MRLKSKGTVFLVMIIFCLTILGCGKTKVENKEVNNELPKNEETGQEVIDTSNTTDTGECDEADQQDVPTTWELIKTIQPPEKNFVCRMAGFLNESVGISTAKLGVLNFTTDGGDTWSHGKNKSDCIAGLEIIDEKNAFITANYSEVRVTNDGGANWSELPNYGDMINEHCRYLSFLDPMTGWIANLKEVGCTIDGGKTWTSISVPEEIQKISAIWLSSMEEGYILSSDGKLYSTSDGGTTWTEKELSIPGLTVLVCPTAALHVSDKDHIQLIAYSGEKQGFYYYESTDGGSSWNKNELLLEGGEGYINFSRDGKIVTLTDAKLRTIQVYEFKSQE